MIVTFVGHNTGVTQEVKDWLYKTIEQIISDGSDTFYLGGYGGFDQACASALAKLKKSHPHISRVLVIPYLNAEVDKELYDKSYYSNLETVPKRFVISKRNEAMVTQADMIISFVKHDIGSGAYKTLAYGRRKGKVVLNFEG